jgi:hypothetical protein
LQHSLLQVRQLMQVTLITADHAHWQLLLLLLLAVLGCVWGAA